MTKIQWTNRTWNPIVGCSKISEGCQQCYAQTVANSARLQQFPQYQKVAQWNGTVEFVQSQLLKPLSWKQPQHIFVCSMSDLFHHNIPFDWIDQVFAVMALANHHTYQILTKRPQRMQQYFLSKFRPRVKKLIDDFPIRLEDKIGKGHCFDHLWLGTTIENQEVADQRLLALLGIPTNNLKFISGEPLLGEIDLSIYFGLYQIEDNGKWFLKFGSRWAKSPDWVIVGGESGSNARACNVEWIRSIVKQCQASEVPVFVKQLGSNPVDNEGKRIKLKHRQGGNVDEFPADLQLRQFPNN